jgi:hypothetical protein
VINDVSLFRRGGSTLPNSRCRPTTGTSCWRTVCRSCSATRSWRSTPSTTSPPRKSTHRRVQTPFAKQTPPFSICIKNRELFPLTATPEDPAQPYLLHASWTPKQGHALVIVFNYDIYYRPGPRGNLVYRLTEDAVPGVVSNGVPDWVYEGEFVFSLYTLRCFD